ncbi:hypothetical protein BKA67DRAFT_530323 [Truncatella angustata]|uniref:Uncharacterized protein n=1 Tax=Truncatella angustata TaxID=152316 RepID=A0A9P8UXI3_9PEZI|nr:uncharacterized protein BKA67DRAFT_530323 [Truncatella angustata]KAH6660208.1 hypothetical protein BKA67DRAFT_530323 [Truncatella angustata]
MYQGLGTRCICNQRRSRRGHSRDALLNSAVDDILALCTCDAISGGKTGKPLETLKLHTTGGISFGVNDYQNDLMDVVQQLSRSFLLEQNPQDDHDRTILRELGQRVREARNELDCQSTKEFKVK